MKGSHRNPGDGACFGGPGSKDWLPAPGGGRFEGPVIAIWSLRMAEYVLRLDSHYIRRYNCARDTTYRSQRLSQLSPAAQRQAGEPPHTVAAHAPEQAHPRLPVLSSPLRGEVARRAGGGSVEQEAVSDKVSGQSRRNPWGARSAADSTQRATGTRGRGPGSGPCRRDVTGCAQPGGQRPRRPPCDRISRPSDTPRPCSLLHQGPHSAGSRRGCDGRPPCSRLARGALDRQVDSRSLDTSKPQG